MSWIQNVCFVFTTKASFVFFLLFCAFALSKLKKKIPVGFLFFSISSILVFFGIVSSDNLFFSFVNGASISMLCLYIVAIIALEMGAVEEILEAIYAFSRGRSLQFYLLLTAFASFFPLRRMERKILLFLGDKNKKSKQNIHFLFPILFVLASSLTLLGSATSLVSDHISKSIFQKRGNGFFTYGLITFTLLLASGLFLFVVVRMQSRKKRLAAVALDASFKVSMPQENSLIMKEFSGQSTHLQETIYQINDQVSNAHSLSKAYFQKKIIKIILLALIVLSICGVNIVYASSSCALVGLAIRGNISQVPMKRLPWDLLLLTAASFLFCRALVETNAYSELSAALCRTNSKILVMTFLLFGSGLLSFFLPALVAVAVIAPLALACSTHFHLKIFFHFFNSAVLGSFFLFPSHSLISFDKTKNSSNEKLFLFKLHVVWVAIVYLVFCTHILLEK